MEKKILIMQKWQNHTFHSIPPLSVSPFRILPFFLSWKIRVKFLISLTLSYKNRKLLLKCSFLFFYIIGYFAGIPAFLGYFFGVELIFSITTSVLFISVSGSWKDITSFIFPPSVFIAFFAPSSSSSVRSAL